MQKKITSFDGIKINYDIDRIGKRKLWLVIVHGAGGDLTAWNPERKFFCSQGYRTLALDLRGHGLSDRPENFESYKLEHFAEDIHQVILKEKIREFALIGHCFGGMVIIKFHELHPKLARSYILIDTSYKGHKAANILFDKASFAVRICNRILENHSTKKSRFQHNDFSKFAGKGDWNARRICSDILHTSLKSWMFTYEHMTKFHGIKILKSISQPLLVIHGEEDSVFDKSIGRKIHKLVANSKLEIIPDANHVIVINNPKVLQKTIIKFVETL
jgi:pimeloyl-ACP methyl ester carboxylesterase